MLQKINRLQKDRDFMKVFKIAKPMNTENFAIRVLYRSSPTKLRNDRNYESTKNYSKEIATPSTKGMARNDNAVRPTRIGIVISNKIDKRATRRNELKRKIRAIVRDILPGLNSGLDIIIQVKKAPEYPYNYPDIKAQIERALIKKS